MIASKRYVDILTSPRSKAIKKQVLELHLRGIRDARDLVKLIKSLQRKPIVQSKCLENEINSPNVQKNHD